ncbi:chain length determinant protein EpsF [Derxia gummosa]|uniref:Chain length determinant protein EpsF n=1 Tax=Derxia gummosa DSM 723 TaxID=1121388 RepID=A0A8B6XCC5_9BURK|nr:chain length determinant protein EpsF [Derxia gummosa]
MQQLFAIFAARRHGMAAVLGTTLLLGVLVVWLMPERYKATAQVLIELKSPSVVSSSVVVANQTVPSYIATQMDVINSTRVALRVVDQLRLAEQPAWKARWQDEADGLGELRSFIAHKLQDAVDARPSRDSNVVSIVARAHSPELSAAIANGFARAYVETNLDLRVDPARRYSDWLEERSAGLRTRLEEAQARLSAYQRKHGIVNADDRMDIENARLQELSAQLTAVQAQQAESASRNARRGDGDALPEAIQSPLVQNLRLELARKQGLLDDLRERYGARHPEVRSAESEVASLRRQLDGEVRRVASGLGSSDQTNAQRVAAAQSALDAQKARVLALMASRDEMQVLLRDVQAAQRALDTVATAQSQSELEGSAQATNVSVLAPAEVPIEPSAPRPALWLAIAFALGVALAIAWALYRESRQRPVHSVRDVYEHLGLPVLGQVMVGPALAAPTPTRPRLGRGARRSLFNTSP